MNIDQIYKGFQDNNPEQFNEDLIFMRRKENDAREDFFHKLFSSLKIPHIEFLESKVISDEYEQLKYINNYSSNKKLFPIEQSRLDLVVARFKLDLDSEEEPAEEYTFIQFFPKLKDDFFFELSGNKYFGIYQISDKNFYSTRKALYLKTLLMPLGLKHNPFSFTSMDGTTYNGLEYKLEIFKSKANSLKNMMLYYFIEYGKEALDYVFNDYKGDGDLPLVFIVEDNYDEYEGYDAYEIRKGVYFYFSTNKEFIDNENYVNLLCTVVGALKGIRKPLDGMFEPLYLKKRILNTTTSNVTKADKAILSLKRILDQITKDNLDLPEHDKSDTFAIARYMAWNFVELSALDSVHLANRRLRLFEYMVYPLLTKLSDATYRILNSRNLTIKRLKNVFSSIKPSFVVRNLINNELLRYNNSTSTMELFPVALRFSARGPQALGSAGGGITLKYRSVHYSYIGNIGLTMASASDPGMTGSLCPLSHNIKDFKFNIED